MGKMLLDARVDLGKQGRTSRSVLLAGSSLLAMGTALMSPRAATADTIVTAGATSLIATQATGNVTLTNSGTLSGGATALTYADGISFLINQGLIQGSIRGLYLAGTQAAGYVTLTTLVNTGSIVATGNAIEIAVGNTLVSLVNSGMVQGNLLLNGDTAVSLYGGTGGATGTFIGVDGTTQGVITSGADITLASGNLLLNDAVNVGGNTLVNSGAAVTLSTIVSVTGNYRQSAGELALGGGAELVISGSATVTGGTVSAFLGNLSTSGNYVAGDAVATLIAAGSGSYSGITANLGSGLANLGVGQGTDGSNLLAVATSDYIGGTLGSVTNTGSITALYVAATGSLGGFRNETTGTISDVGGVTLLGVVGTLDNAGQILVRGTSSTGAFNAGGHIGTLNNSGTIRNTGSFGVGMVVRGTIGQLVNQAGGSISGYEAIAVVGPTSNNGTATTINTVSNSGFIGGGYVGVEVDGTIGQLRNQAGGTIAGSGTAIHVYGGITTLTNSGLIQSNYHAIDIGAAQFIGGTIGLLDNQAGGTIVGSQVGVANTVIVHTLVNSGIITGGNQGVLNQVIIGTLENLAGGTITASGGGTSTAIRNVAIMGTLTNAGLIAGNYGLYVGAGGTLDAFSNSGTLTGRHPVAAIGNSGALAAIGGIANSGTMVVGTTFQTGTAIQLSYATIGQISNSGTVVAATNSFNSYIIYADGSTIGSIANDGLVSIQNGVFALNYNGTIGTVSNSGVFNGGGGAFLANDGYGGGHGTVGVVENSGTITTAYTAIKNWAGGTLGTVVNSGTIIGRTAFYNSGTFGTLVNSGLMQGSIINLSGTDLTIQGGDNGTLGTFTGTSLTNMGTILNTTGNVVLAGGGLLLNDNLVVTGHTVLNNGATLALNTIVTVSGDYAQTGGGLNLGGDTMVTGGLAVSGVGSLSGVGVTATLSTLGNYLAGSVYGTLVSAAGGLNIDTMSYTLAGAALVGTTLTGTDLLAVATGDYIGGTLDTLTNSGSISQVYVGAAGSLGTLVNATGAVIGNGVILYGTLGALSNSGAIIGDITNFSANALTIVNGNAATLTGGTLSSTLANVTLSGGSLLLADQVNLASGTLVNDGVNLTLGTIVSVTGTYAQAGGGLTLASGARLVVSGDASISGASVASSIALTYNANYLAGTVLGTLVAAGAGSGYTGLSLANEGGLNGVATAAVGVDGNLVAQVTSDYIGSALATLTNSGTLSGAYGLYIGYYGSLGSFANTGTIAATTGPGVSIVGAAGTLDNSGLISSTGVAVSINNYGQTVGLLLNSGTIAGGGYAGVYMGDGTVGTVLNTTGGTMAGGYGGFWMSGGSIGLFDNAGLITGTLLAINTGGSIGTLVNEATGSIVDFLNNGIQNGSSVHIGTLSNAGLIGGAYQAIQNYGTIDILENQSTGTLTATGQNGHNGQAAVVANIRGIIGTLSNAGLISASINNFGGNGGIQNLGGTIAVFDNSGTIGGNVGIGNYDYAGASGIVGTLINSGLIIAQTQAIYNNGTIGTLINSGVVAGDVVNNQTNGGDLTILGGTGGTVGTFTDYTITNRGTITSTLGSLVFAGGSLLLNDRVNATGHTVFNTGADITLASVIAITGDYSQSAGTLVLGGRAQLSVTGAATLAGGGVRATADGIATANYIVGDGSAITLVQADGGLTDTADLTVTNTLAQGGHLALGASTLTASQLLVLPASDYIGAGYGTLDNSGSLMVAGTALYIASTGSLGALANSGTIGGTITNDSAYDLSIQGGTGGTTGTLTGGSLSNQGTITSTLANVVLSGKLLLNDAVNVGTGTLVNSGGALTLATVVGVTGAYAQAGGTLALATGAGLVVSGAASISGATVTIARQSTLGNYVAGGVYATLVAGGAGSNYTSLSVTTGSHALGLAGTVSNNGLLLAGTGDYIGGSLGSLANSGTLAGFIGLTVAQAGRLGTFTNDGLISISGGRAADNYGSIGLLENTSIGTITGTIGLYSGNNGTLSTLANAGLISGTYGVYLEYTQVTLLTNSGTLEALAGTGVPVALNLSQSTLSTLVNSGLVSTDGYGYGVNLNFATINTLVNQGTIAAGIGVKMAYASLTTLENSGTLSGTTAIQNSYGVGIGTLVNSGTIMGFKAYLGFANASLGTLVNSGLIRGGIYNGSTDYNDTVAGDLTIQGGTGGTVGTFTGQDGTSTGVIYNSLSNLVFASGALLLNDDVRANGQTVTNTGAAITLANTINLTGAYSQYSTGTLVLGAASQLNVIGAASIAGQVEASVAGDITANYLVGDTVGTLVQASGGLTYTGTFVNGGALDGHAQLTVGTSSGELLALATTDYIGAAYGTLSIGGLLTGPTALYIASTGSLGAVVNSGTIAGNITNLSSYDLSITGGTLTGVSLTNQGTITNTLSNVVLGGTLALNDAVNVGGGTVIAHGATLRLTSIVSVTGNYSQAGGALALGSGADLVVSGAASISNASITATYGLSATGNYVTGTALATLVAGGTDSDYTDVIVTNQSTLTGLGLSGAVSGENLLLAATSDYIGGNYGSLTNSGALTGAYGLYVASTGTLAAFSNSGSISGTFRPVINAGTIGTLENLAGGTITVTTDPTGRNYTAAIYNTGRIGTISNAGLIAIDVGSYSYSSIAAIENNGGSIGQVVNASGGTISGRLGIDSNGGTIATISNAGLISAISAIRLYSARSTLVTNSGTLSSDAIGTNLIDAYSASIGTIANSGLITVGGGGAAVAVVYGTAGTILNSGTITVATGTGIFGYSTGIDRVVNSGTIIARSAVVMNSAGLNTLVNSGLIGGAVVNGQLGSSANALTIVGGTGGTVGTFTGVNLTSKGVIVNSVSSLMFASGALFLNDDIRATGQTVYNAGAALTLGTLITLTGNYAQSSIGTLVLGSVAALSVTGTATVSGQVQASVAGNAAGNYLAGDTVGTLVQATGGLTYDGTLVGGNALGGHLQVTDGTTSSQLLAVASTDYVGGTLDSIVNGGLVSGVTALYIAGTGSLGALINTGIVAGNIVNLSTHDLSIAGGTSSALGTLTGSTLTNQGTITNTLSNVVLSGYLLLNDTVNLGGHTLVADGAGLSLTTIVTVTGGYTQAGGAFNLGGGAELVVTGAASISNVTIATSYALSSTANYLAGTVLGTAVAGGANSSYVNLTGYNLGGAVNLAIAGTTSGDSLLVAVASNYIGGTYGGVANTGTLSGTTGLYVASTGTLGTFTNSGAIGFPYGTGIASNGGTIGTIDNGGTIGGGRAVNLFNGAQVTLLNNDGGTLTGALTAVYVNHSTIGALANSGLIAATGSAQALRNYGGSIGSVSNSGTIQVTGASSSALAHAVENTDSATIATLANSGLITSNAVALYNETNGFIGTLVNGGTISSGSGFAIRNIISSTIGTVLNSGVISGVNALYNGSGSGIGLLVNSGTIAGTIYNGDLANLTIQGGDGGTIGTLTGQNLTGRGVIDNQASDLVFSGGALLLNDNVIATGHTVLNAGATLGLSSIITVTGDYAQSAGALVLGSVARLSVTGAASIGGQVQASINGTATANYLVGATVGTLVQAGGGLTLDGTFISTGAVGGHLEVSGVTTSSQLLALATSDYVGTVLNSIVNTSLLSGATALYIAGTGRLGTLVNTGTVAGNIVNAGSSFFSIAGGTGATVGTLTGVSLTNQGTITSANTDVVLSGNLLLNDTVSIGNHTLDASGANLTLATIVTIAGNYGQLGGTLALASGAGLVVSDAANINGASISTAYTLSSTGNYMAGTVFGTVVAGDADSSYTNLVVTNQSAVTGLALAGVTSGGNLLVAATGDYIGGTYGSLANSGSLSGAYGLYVAGTGTLAAFSNNGVISGRTPIINQGGIGSLSNSGTVQGQYAGLSNAGTIATLVNSASIGQSGGTFGSAIGASVGLRNTGTIGSLSNTGVINGDNTGLYNAGKLATLANSGVIVGGNFGLRNNTGGASIGTLANSGTIGSRAGAVVINSGTIGLLDNQGSLVSGFSAAVAASGGTIGTLLNSGTMSGAQGVMVANLGSIGTVDNRGLITGSGQAVTIRSNATLGLLINSAVIAGTILNQSARDLSIQGGDTVTGTFSGGLIANTASDLVFTSGRLLLNDAVDVTGHTRYRRCRRRWRPRSHRSGVLPHPPSPGDGRSESCSAVPAGIRSARWCWTGCGRCRPPRRHRRPDPPAGGRSGPGWCGHGPAARGRRPWGSPRAARGPAGWRPATPPCCGCGCWLPPGPGAPVRPPR
ncbi:S-layer family protein [Azospirillum sp. B4]|uniref:S-layer family protein n=1 Tax=Azospirillum sp. B4 TaxID=95605 RepID=UPI00034AA1D6|nr:S-layer family protein [Azospirillum sp. B4]